MSKITESDIEQYTIEELKTLGFQFLHGPDIAPDGEFPERQAYSDIVLVGRLRAAIQRLNPNIPAGAREQALREVQRINSPELLTNNESFHHFLTDGVPVTYRSPLPLGEVGRGSDEKSDYVWLIDFNNPLNNEFLMVNQYTVIENNQNKRPDILLFVNGIPLVLIELKNPADENATIKKAFDQIQTYKATIPSLFTFNAFCVISDGHECKAGSTSAGYNRFMAWKLANGKKEVSKFVPELEILIQGMLNPITLLDLVRNFIVFEKSISTKPSPLHPSPSGRGNAGEGSVLQIETVKKVAAYHQYYAVNKAIESTLRAAGYFQPSISPSQKEGINASPFVRDTREGVCRESHYRGGLVFSGLLNKAKELRKKQTPAEEVFWQLVRDKKFFGLKFRRQHQIGPYIVDFYCHEHKLIVELDGEIHQIEGQQKHDTTKDKYLTSLGNKVIRFANNEILTQTDKTLEKIANLLSLWERSGEGNVGNKKAGVIWHTQGSGKSLSMVFYAGKLITSEAMQNPTIVVITDRNDLDDQLFDTFASSKQLLRQEPVQARDREDLKDLLKVASGGIVFTTIQKFLPEAGKAAYDRLSDRDNIVVIADEAHRTQYGFEAKLHDERDKDTKEVIGKRIAYGFAKYMRDALPNATYIGFTGTPIESTDVNTPAVFGQYVDIYDISQSVADGATVKIYYESRLAKVNLDEEGRRLIEEFDKELEEDEEITDKQRAKAKWTKLEAIVGNQERIKNLARDIVTHFEQRQAVFDGKAMIVAMSRRIAVDLYNEIIKLRPEWYNDDLTKGVIKVIMTASSADGPVMQKQHTTKTQRKALSDRMKDPADPLKLVVVRDMWLTGFDAPCLHTLYVDKPMRGHNLMQAIARVNRIFKDKPGGLVVDYLGIATDLKKALAFYADSGGKGDPAESQEKAVEMFIEKLEVVRQLFLEESKTKEVILAAEPTAYYGNYPGTGFNYKRFFSASPKEKLSIILQAEEHILGLADGKNRFINEVTLLSKAFALSIPHEKALAVKDEVAFFQAVKARLVKFISDGTGRSDIDIETAIKQIIDEALSSDQVVDIFDAAGIKKPEISILSEEFLLEIQGMKHQNLALELLKRILNDEIRSRSKTNLVRSKALLEMLETTIKKYQNNLLSAAEIIQKLIELAREIKTEDRRGVKLGLSEDELAFYDALETNNSAVQVLGDERLRLACLEVWDT